MRLNTSNRSAEAAGSNGHANGGGRPHDAAAPRAVPSAASPGPVTVTVAVALRSQPPGPTCEASTEEIDEAKVARLKAAIDDGSFHIDSAAIAQKIINERG